jgi:hypothetical protein
METRAEFIRTLFLNEELFTVTFLVKLIATVVNYQEELLNR